MASNDGGPAFPRQPARIEDTSGDISWFDEQDGMSLRDYFAGQVLIAIAAEPDVRGAEDSRAYYDAAHRAYQIADAMVAARRRL